MPSDRAGDEENPQRRMSLRDFTIVRAVGEGNMGRVYLVKTKKNNDNNQTKPMAMKVMRKEDARMQRLLRARREAEILSALDHPFLPSLVASFESDVHFFIVTKYCSGGDLNVLRQRLPDKRFSETAARFYGAEVVLALEHLHGLGIVYRDLKPENVLVQESGHIVLTDFDLSLRLLPDDAKLEAEEVECRCICTPHFGHLFGWRFRPGTVCPGASLRVQGLLGTEEYMAPEVVLGRGHGFPVDWWTLGIFLYELVFGKTPFQGKDRTQTWDNVVKSKPEFPGRRRPLYDLIARLLAKEPTRRPGAEDIKRHSFFEGIRWDCVQHVSRPPYIPAPLSLESADSKPRGLAIEP